ncbi:CAP domain-containing protein [bacterium]|nr:CAP domain-containing protein [bacterium]
MRPLLFILFLALFVVPLGIDRRSHAPSPSNLSPSESETVTWVDSKPSRVSTTSAQATARAETPQPTVVAPVTTVVAAEAAPVVETKPAAEPTTPIDVIAEMETEILRLTNEERVEQGLPALTFDTKLHSIATLHSEDMLANDYFEHEDPDGCSSSCRATNAGYRWRAIGENIYMMSGYKIDPAKMAAQVVAGWMDSPGHRANILGTSFAESGVGVAIKGKDVYVTAVYGKER